MASYASPSDLLERTDRQNVAMLASDREEAVPDANLATDTNVLAALADASGDVESAMLVGERYSVEDLEGLTGNSLAKLKRIVCTIAYAYLIDRRPGIHINQADRYLERADKYLEDLRQGKRMFNVADNVGRQTPTIGGPTALEYKTLNTFVDRANGRYLPTRESRLPQDR